MQGQAPSPQLELDISRLEKEIELYSQEKFCYEAQILRVLLISSSLSISALNVAPILYSICIGYLCLMHIWIWYADITLQVSSKYMENLEEN